jgi:soluble lytic murein transglycosylase-like protein
MNPLERYDSLFQYYANLHGFDWLRLKAQGMAESNLDPLARSGTGALGVMQFMPATFKEYAEKTRLGLTANPYNPEHSIQCAALYMNDLMRRYFNNWDKALAAYNWGMGNIDRSQSEIDYPAETVAYIKRCHSNFNSLL